NSQVQRSAVIRISDRFAQHITGVPVVIHGDNFHSWPYAGFCRREFGKHVNDRTVTVESKADRIGHTQTGPNLFGSPLRFRRLLDIRQTITARLHSTERGAIGSRSIQPRLEKALPVIKSDTVERFNEVLKSVWLHLRRAAGRSVKQPAKIVERFPALSLLADIDVGLQPHQQPLVVEIDATPS